MTAKLVIRDFGPLNNIDIEINKFNIFIGPHGAGKSTISKVLCVIHFLDQRIIPKTNEKRSVEIIKSFLVHYRIENFYQKRSYWLFEDDVMVFKLEKGEVSILYKKEILQTDCYYFPAERIALPMINESIFELAFSQSSLPEYFLKFGQDFTIARKNQQIFNLSLLNIEYEYSDNQNKVFLNKNQQLLLTEASSAVQANLPMLVTMEYPIRNASLFVIEELELHNFPDLQKKLLYHVINRMKHPKLRDSYLILPTHSPYLLSAANNLLFAAKVAQKNPENKIAIDNIISEKSWIDRNDFSAYFIENGYAETIVDANTGMIFENRLDSISEGLAEEFDDINILYSPSLV